MTETTQSVRISLTQFTNFALKAGPEQLTAVRTIKKQHSQPYSPAPDPYKRFRAGVIRTHQNNLPKQALDALIDAQTDPNKQEDYPELVAGYKSFWGRKKMDWFQPPAGIWSVDDLEISVKPELGLIIDGDAHLIKMYPNKPRELDKRKAAVVMHVMRLAIPAIDEMMKTCILDVRKGKLFSCSKLDADAEALLHGQAKLFIEVYRRL